VSPWGFTLKQLLGILLTPSVAAVLLGLVGVLLLATRRWRMAGARLMAALFLLLAPLSITPVADAIIRPFERRYEAVLDPRELPEAQSGELRWVVVLGSGLVWDESVPPPARLAGEGLHRVVEGVRLMGLLPDAQLHLSGWGGRAATSFAEAAAEVARGFGVPRAALTLAREARDTAEEAAAVALVIPPGEPFLLVSGAAHLPRAVELFQAEGLSPIPAPAFFYALERNGYTFRDYIPSPIHLLKVDRAAHEFFGILWARLSTWMREWS